MGSNSGPGSAPVRNWRCRRGEAGAGRCAEGPAAASRLVHRSDVAAAETSLSAGRREDYSRLAAGWNWQVRPNWGLRAEANYVLNTSGQPGVDYGRRQLVFRTSLGF